VERMENPELTPENFTALVAVVVELCAESGHPEIALKLIDHIETNRLEPELLTLESIAPRGADPNYWRKPPFARSHYRR
jgi:hypothetical protein